MKDTFFTLRNSSSSSSGQAPGGVQPDDLVGVAGARVVPAELEPLGGDHAGLLPQLALRGLEGVLPRFELAGGRLEHVLHVGVPELLDEQDGPVRLDGQDAHAARVLDDFTAPYIAVRHEGVIVADRQDATAEHIDFSNGFFFRFHTVTPLEKRGTD